MHAFIIWFFLLSCFSIIFSGGLPVPTFPPTSSTSHGTNDAFPTPPNAFSPSTASIFPRAHVHELANASHDSQPGLIAPFPKYAVILLALTIIVCAISSAAVIMLFYAHTTRERVVRVARRVWGPPTGAGPQAGRKENEKDNDDKTIYKQEEKVLDITQNTSGPSIPTENGNTSKTESTAASSTEKVDTSLTLSTGDVSTSDDKVKPTETHTPSSPGVSRLSGSPKSSSSPDALRKLVSASTSMLLHLTSIISPTEDTAEDLSDVTTPHTQTERSSDRKASSPTTRDTLTPPGDDNNSTHTGGSQNSTSSTAFYSLGDVLSPSVAFHSLVDLAALSTTREFDPSATHEPFEESDIADELASPRYVPGVQLETIQEESESTTSLYSQLTRPVSSRKSFLDYIDYDAPQRLASTHNEATADEPPYTRLSASMSLTDRIPTTWEELAIDPQNPTLPRFFPAARPAPSPSEPSSTVSVVSALRSPYRQERRHSVAWLSPVIEWAVDDPRENLDEREPVAAEDQDECEDALQAADAMAVVMDSLAAIGMDPADMGLTGGGSTSPSLSADSPPQPATDALTANENNQPQAAAADEVEEDEVEMEIGVESEPKSPSESPFCAQGAREERDYDLFSSPLALPSFSKASEAFVPAHDLGTFGDLVDDGKSSSRSDHRKSTGSPMEQHPRASSRRSKSMGGVGSPFDSQTFRTPRGVKPDRAYPSPSSLAGLSPAEVTKRFSTQSTSSTESPPAEPHAKRPLSPQHHFSPVSPLQVRKAKGTAFSPPLRSTPSTLTSSPRSDTGSVSPRSESPLFYKRYIATSPSTPRASGSPHRSTGSTRPLAPRKNMHKSSSSPISLSQWQKPTANSQLPSVLQERSNSMEFV